MGRHTGPKYKLSRREKQDLFGSPKSLMGKSPLEKKNYPPGEHGQSRRQKISEYGVQLREKQKIKRIYGLYEKQFRNLFEKASRQKGITGENLIKLLERRLDNVVYRLGFAPTRVSARQLVSHRHVLVNDKTVNVPSFVVSVGDVIRIREKSKKMDAIHNSLKKVRDNQFSWLTIDKATLSGTFIQVPERSEIPLNASEQLVVELYSK
ncbi:MAG: 30S ribosomal protein S4 [Ignavibacteria bacterium GWA2_35_9]|nr:MAG: 30S ribosomal protein S4 [Ignavibacteria bacterium GWA2_35_9]OGU46890.1 MAG: 30S ribosomal protein S4 [Ignavibacteria bacterium GWB2_36_8]OGU52059.1 MAG: 30S ribosomal protein S4 [Ignavibacteria bacterium GWC2_36_12]OGV10875.1 MAG: 30S ribosomal protein S4 [Ignavibacteria bacterium RIFOXYB2_FULL_36_7]